MLLIQCKNNKKTYTCAFILKILSAGLEIMRILRRFFRKAHEMSADEGSLIR